MSTKASRYRAAAVILPIFLSGFLAGGCEEQASSSGGGMTTEAQIEMIRNNPQIPAAEKEKAIKRIQDSARK